MTKTTNGDGGEIIAMDLPYDCGAPVVLDLTAREIVAGETTEDWSRDETPAPEPKKEGTMTEQPYERWLREQAAGETAAAATDMSEEDRMYAAFVEQSGLNDMLGRTPATGAAADLSAPPEDGAVETSGAGAEDARLYRQFVEQSGMSWMLGDAGGGSADLSEGAEAGKREESLREQAEADALHESLRRQSHEDHFGEPSDASDDEMWERYRSALGQS